MSEIRLVDPATLSGHPVAGDLVELEDGWHMCLGWNISKHSKVRVAKEPMSDEAIESWESNLRSLYPGLHKP